MQEKLRRIAEADDAVAAMRKELEEEHETIRSEVAKIYKTEKERLQDTIEDLKLELSVSILQNIMRFHWFWFGVVSECAFWISLPRRTSLQWWGIKSGRQSFTPMSLNPVPVTKASTFLYETL